MSDGKTTALDGLREEIDAIDTAIHDLLMRRADLADRIGRAKESAKPAAAAEAAKPPAVYLRPGREAMVLRRLVRRHSGPFPVPSLVRLWREIMSALLRLQGPFSVAVYAAGGDGAPRPGYWDLARDYYGSSTPMTPCQGASQVVREVAEGRATVGVLPFPEQGEAAPWWPMLFNAGPDEPRIFARLPFFEGASDRGGAAVSAVAIARVAPEQTGEDRSLLGIETVEEVSRARLISALSAVGLKPLFIVDDARGDQRGSGRHLVEVDGFVTSEDGSLAQFSAALGSALGRIAVLGTYAATLSDQETAPRKSAGRGQRS
ncbi:MAG TPA: chorismate mutase [Alphaproteobacteria bacterium]|jgi:chorismate mutase-like protein